MKRITEQPTKVRKTSHGIFAESVETILNQTYEITTSKTYDGRIYTSVYKVEKSKGDEWTVTSYSPLTDRVFSYNHGRLRATEKAIRECHNKGLIMFDKHMATLPQSELIKEEVEVGDVLFLDGYGKGPGSDGNHWIVYNIMPTSSTKTYQCIEKDTLELKNHSYVNPYSKKFGIGMYFKKEMNMAYFGIDENKLADMLIDAQDVMKKKREQEEAERLERNKKAEERKKYLSQFIQADVRQTTNIIKRHILKTWNVSKVSIKTDSFSGGTSMHVHYTSPDRIEELEDFVKNFRYGHFNSMEDIYEYSDEPNDIILEGHILVQYKYCSTHHVEGEGKPEPKEEKQDIQEPTTIEGVSDIQIIDYSEKSIAVIGDTKPIKETLKNIRGRFNPRLTCGPGWVFPKTRKEEIQKMLNLNK